jgi:hypothetical protein
MVLGGYYSIMLYYSSTVHRCCIYYYIDIIALKLRLPVFDLDHLSHYRLKIRKGKKRCTPIYFLVFISELKTRKIKDQQTFLLEEDSLYSFRIAWLGQHLT